MKDNIEDQFENFDLEPQMTLKVECQNEEGKEEMKLSQELIDFTVKMGNLQHNTQGQLGGRERKQSMMVPCSEDKDLSEKQQIAKQRRSSMQVSHQSVFNSGAFEMKLIPEENSSSNSESNSSTSDI